MWLGDPSEAVDAESILPSLHGHFKILEEKKIGGNILMPLLKDISPHFLKEEAKPYLYRLFEIEDRYLINNNSLLTFGVYQKT